MSFINPPASGGGVVQTYATVGDLPGSATDGTIAYVEPPTDSLYVYSTASNTWNLVGGGGVAGPGSSTDNAVVRFDGTTGQTLQNSGVIISDTNNVTGINNLTVTGTTTLAAALSGPIRASSGVISTGQTNLTSEVTGTLPVANGGTNSATALNNNRVMVSNSGAIVETAAITASRALVSDTNGLPVAATTTATEIGYVNGVTSSIQTQLDGKEPTQTKGSISTADTAVTITNGANSTVGPNVSFAFSDATPSVHGFMSTADKTKLDSIPVPAAATFNKFIYVSQFGSDVTGDGTYEKPFATTAAALALTTTASTTNRFCIFIQGTVTEANIYLKPWVWYVGNAWGTSRLNANVANAVTLDPSWAGAVSGRTGITNVYLTGSTGINLNFVTLGALGSCVIEIDNIGCNGAVNIQSNNTNQYFQWRSSLNFSSMTIGGTLGFIFDSYLVGGLTLNNGTNNLNVNGLGIQSCYIGGTTTITSTGGNAAGATFVACRLIGALTVDGSAAAATLDAVSMPLRTNITLTNGGTITRSNDAGSLRYTPVTTGDWNTVPTTNQEALDTLATSGIVDSQTAKFVLAAPNATNGVPSFRQIVSTDITGVTSDLQTQIDGKLNLTGGTLSGFLTLNADPTTALQAATKQYVDAISQGVAWKQSVKAATTADITLSGNQTIDGIALVDGDRVLVKNQSTTSENGIYVVDNAAWSRSSDANTAAEINSAAVSVEQGTTNADRGYLQNATVTTLGTDPVTFVQIFGVGTYTADGQGIELTGNVFSLELDGLTLSKSGTGVKVATGGITDTEVNASAAITRSKLATGTANTFVTNDASGVIQSTAVTASRAVVTDSNGLPTASAATATEVGYLSGVTSAIQTQLDGKQTTTLTSGNILVGNGSNVAASVTMSGDITINNTGVTAISSGVIVDADVNASAAIARTKLAAGTNNTFVTNNSSGVMQSTSVTASRAVATDADGLPVASTTTATELGYLAGTTSSVQTQLDAKLNLTGGTLTGNLTVSNANQLRLGELTANGSDYISLRAPDNLAASYDLVMPSTSTSGSLTNDGSGNLSWSPTSVTPAYVGTNPEVGGSSPFQMLSTNNKNSVLNPAGAITVRLPTTGVLAGDTYSITNRSGNNVTLQSSGGNTIFVLNNAALTLTALVNTPTGAGDWLPRQTSGSYVYGNQSSATIGQGYLGEEIFGSNNNFSVGASVGYLTSTSITITANGWWNLSTGLQFIAGGTIFGGVILATSTNSNSFPATGRSVINYTDRVTTNTSIDPLVHIGQISGVIVYLTAGTVVYGNFYRSAAVTVVGGYQWVSAVRIA